MFIWYIMANKQKKRGNQQTSTKKDNSKAFAWLAVFLGIIGFIIAILVKRDDNYVMYYAKQSLVLFIAAVILGLIFLIPILGWILGIIGFILYLILWIIGWVYALSGEMKEIPLIGKFAENFNF